MVLIAFIFGCGVLIMFIAWMMLRQKNIDERDKEIDQGKTSPPAPSWTPEKEKEKRDEYENLDPDGLADDFNNMLGKQRGDTGSGKD